MPARNGSGFLRGSCRGQLSRWGLARRTRSLDAALPTLYLPGVSSGDFGEALSELVGPGGSGLTPGVIGRLKAEWEAEHERWRHRDLSGRRYVYVWADGIYLQGRLEDDKQCLHQIWMATNRKEAEKAMDTFAAKYQARYAEAVTCLTRDREALLAFYDFPAEHWQHIRTTNPIESVFATVRHRTVRSKGCLSHKTALAMVFKLVTAASKTWRRLNGYEQLPRVIQGVKFTDGIPADETETRAAA